MDRSLLLTLHILLLVAWLGIDVGVFTSSFFIRRRGLSADARIELRRVMRGLDLAPRISVVLTMPVALALVDTTGFGQVPSGLLLTVAVIAIGWVAAMVWAFRRMTVLGVPRQLTGTTASLLFTRADMGLRLAALLGFGGFGIASLAGTSRVFAADFVALKAVIFASTILAGLQIRRAARPFGPALRAVVEQGEAEEQLQAMDAAMRRVYPAVLYIWGSLVAMTALAVYRPSFS